MTNEYENCHRVLEFVGVSKDSFYSQIELKEFSCFKDWMKNNFSKNNLQDIVNYGCSGGFNGLTYYFETMALYRQFREDMWEMLNEDYKNFGSENILEFIGTFNWAKNVEDHHHFENLIVWYAAERVAGEILQEIEEKDKDSNIENDE